MDCFQPLSNRFQRRRLRLVPLDGDIIVIIPSSVDRDRRIALLQFPIRCKLIDPVHNCQPLNGGQVVTNYDVVATTFRSTSV